MPERLLRRRSQPRTTRCWLDNLLPRRRERNERRVRDTFTSRIDAENSAIRQPNSNHGFCWGKSNDPKQRKFVIWGHKPSTVSTTPVAVTQSLQLTHDNPKSNQSCSIPNGADGGRTRDLSSDRRLLQAVKSGIRTAFTGRHRDPPSFGPSECRTKSGYLGTN